MRNIIKQILKEEIDSKSERIKSMVNRFGFDQAIEMIVGGMDTIKQAYQDDPVSFLEQFNDLTPVEKDGKIFYVDKDRLPLFMYYQDKKNGNVYINYDRIWMFFSDVIGMEYKEIQGIMKNWLEQTYNLKGLTPKCGLLSKSYSVGTNI